MSHSADIVSTDETTGSSWRHGLRIGLLLLLGLLFFIGLYLRSESVSPGQHHDYTMLLQRLRAADTAVNAETLSSQLELSRSYDVLNANLEQVVQLGAAIEAIPGFLADADRQAMAQLVTRIRQAIAAKAQQIDAFKRFNSVLKNSLAYFSSSAEAFLKVRRDGAVKRSVEAYTRQVLYHAKNPTPARRAEAEAAAQHMLAVSSHSVARPFVENLLAHGKVILSHSAQVDERIDAIMSVESGHLLNQLSQHYLAGYEAALAHAGRYRALAYALGLMLLAFLALTFYRLERTRRSLSAANRELVARHAAQARAEERLRLHDAAFLNAHEGMTLTDLQGTIIDVNPAFTRITGYEREEAIGRNPRVLKSGRHDRSFYEAMWQSIRETGNWRGEIWNRGKYGDIYPEILSISAVHDNDGEVKNYVAVFADISRLKEQEQTLSEMAYYDALTGLPNRILLADRVAQAMPMVRRSGELMAVCYLDLDGFKPVNDTWGHDVGDQVLIKMAERFRACVRGGDTVARLGGDEFVLLLVGLDNVEACEYTVQRVLSAIGEPLMVAPDPVLLSASVGIALFPSDDSDADALMRHADQAMYRAKQSGKNRFYIYDPALDSHVRGQDDQAELIRNGLKQNQFVLHYQPQVNMRTGQVIGVEALLRWQVPERGLLLPDRFLPSIENDPAIDELGAWVIETALSQQDEWRRAGLDLEVSLNIAGHHLLATNFVQGLNDALRRHPDARQRLTVEVIENTALEDVAKVSRVIEECADLGVDFALDDFGTGYSSLTYLKRLPASKIKIDQSFVREILGDTHNLIIVQGVLGLARAFQRQAIAEGVETIEQGRVLLQIECDLAQGNVIARPMPAADIPGWVATWQPDPAWRALATLRWDESLTPMLIAQVHHRNWISQLLYSVKEHHMVPHRHVADPRYCYFGRWCGGGCSDRFKHLASFGDIDTTHSRIHALAGDIDTLLRDGRIAEAKALLPELVTHHEGLLKALDAQAMQLAKPRDRH